MSYDGLHGDQIEDAYWVPRFDTIIEGTWELSWTPLYQDTSLYWEGQASIFSPALTVTGLRVSPLSWEMDMTARELTGEALAWELLPYSWTMQLRRQDGSLTDIPMRRAATSYKPTEDGLYTVTEMTTGQSFDQPIDLSDVAAVVIDGVEFPLS